MLLNHTNPSAPITSLLLLMLILVLPTIAVAAGIEGTLKCGVWQAPLEADTTDKRAAIRAVADVAVDHLCRADRTDCAGSGDEVHNYCGHDEWSEDGSTHVMIDLITKNGVRQDKIGEKDCLELFGKVLQGCVERKWQEGVFTEAKGNVIANVVYEQECESSPTGWCG